MLIIVSIVAALLCVCGARPQEDIEVQNVVTVPTNCPAGQEWINGECRDVWIRLKSELRKLDDVQSGIDQHNMITVPTNCPSGQQWVNGGCRDVWRSDISASNVVTVPTNCPAGQEYINGQCRDVWRRDLPSFQEINHHNVVTVPTNCPNGQEWVNGSCRDVWRSSNPVNSIMNFLKELKIRTSRRAEMVLKVSLSEESDNRNVISVPNQCPAGYKPDALGNCRVVINGN